MSELRPVDRGYDPGYPAGLTADELRDLVRPGLLRRFGAEVLAAGALAAGVSLGVDLAAAPAPKGLPQNGKSTRNDPKIKEKVDKLTAELLEPLKKNAGWNERSSIILKTKLPSNPPVKYPHIPISFGNSYVGIFDTAAASEATRKLFAVWGLELKAGQTIKGPGYEFEADGYDPVQQVGFKIVLPQGEVGLRGQKFPPEPEAKKLDDREVQALERDVSTNKVKVFVVQAAGYPNMDGDLYTPMEYYLQSVIDYLNWVHGDKQIDANKVLGKARQVSRARLRGDKDEPQGEEPARDEKKQKEPDEPPSINKRSP
jgi:hypothetical protein